MWQPQDVHLCSRGDTLVFSGMSSCVGIIFKKLLKLPSNLSIDFRTTNFSHLYLRQNLNTVYLFSATAPRPTAMPQTFSGPIWGLNLRRPGAGLTSVQFLYCAARKKSPPAAPLVAGEGVPCGAGASRRITLGPGRARCTRPCVRTERGSS